MSAGKRRSRTLAVVVLIELAIGAAIWFSSIPSDAEAQPIPPPSASAAPASPPVAEKKKCAPPPKLWKTNNCVTHETFGSGQVVSQIGAGRDAMVVVEFGDGQQTVAAKTLKGCKRGLADDLLPIGILIVVITIVIIRLPKVQLGHTDAFRHRRLLNWLPLGLAYSFLYFGRYNIKQFQGEFDGGLTAAQYGTVFGIGSAVYGLAFLLNGPLTDRWGGRRTILIATAGSGVANVLMGYMAITGKTFGMSPTAAYATAFAMNMYFQSFGAVSIVKVNAAWFHLRERGTFGGIFGILISLGLYFAYDVGKRIVDLTVTEKGDTAHWLFWIPAMILGLFFILCYIFVRNSPSDTGHPDFDLGDATKADEPSLTVMQVFVKLLTHPVILIISFIELCSGFLRQAILQWGVDFGKALNLSDDSNGWFDSFVFQNWGMVSCIAGITGGIFAGAISDHMFNSRRSPVSAVLYGIMLVGAIAIVPLLTWEPGAIGWVVALMSMAIIGVHGMLTATASADFAGKKNTGMAVGIIDGFVYVGSTIQSFLYGAMLPSAKIEGPDGCPMVNPASSDVTNWYVWPVAMIPVALIGFALTLKIWNAKPGTRSSSGH
jgi:OPA family glycerol-3-phosphate transporter-like MFS transporter